MLLLDTPSPSASLRYTLHLCFSQIPYISVSRYSLYISATHSAPYIYAINRNFLHHWHTQVLPAPLLLSDTPYTPANHPTPLPLFIPLPLYSQVLPTPMLLFRNSLYASATPRLASLEPMLLNGTPHRVGRVLSVSPAVGIGTPPPL
jgi:hypothetical protein